MESILVQKKYVTGTVVDSKGKMGFFLGHSYRLVSHYCVCLPEFDCSVSSEELSYRNTEHNVIIIQIK